MPPPEESRQRRNERAELGLAIGQRADEVYERTIALLYRKAKASGAVTEAYLDYRWGRSVVGTLLIARWLVSGIVADKDEIEWISKSGGAAARERIRRAASRNERAACASQSIQIGVPRQDEPSAPDTVDRDHRLLRSPEAGHGRRAQPRSGSGRRRDPQGRTGTSRAGQRHPRPVEDRGGQD